MGLSLAEATERFTDKFKESGKLTREGKKYIPGGYSRDAVTYGPHPIYIESGEGQYLYTADGHQLLDFHNNFTVSILGHNHPSIREALMDAIPKGFSFGNPMKHEQKLAQILTERIASVERVVFTCSASEACIGAARLARAYTGKNKVAKFEGGYHGHGNDFVFSLLPFPFTLPGPATHPAAVPLTSGVPSFVRENVVILPQNDFESCEQILSQNAFDIACVFMELQTSAGYLVKYEEAFVQKLRELTRDLGIALVFDETINLRADYHGMQSLYDVTPDLTVMGKIIGGGMPLGAVGGSDSYMRLNEEKVVWSSGTHHGHPISCIAGAACMEVMDEPTYKRINDYGERIKAELNAWAQAKNYPFFLHGYGSHLGYEFPDKPGREYTSCRDILQYTKEEQMQTFAIEMANRGIFPFYRGQIALSVPMTEENIQTFIDTTKDIVEDILGVS